MFGYPPHELIGRDIKSIFLKDGSEFGIAPPENECLEQAVTRKLPELKEKWGLRRDGTRVPMEVSCAFIESLELTICVIRDISERRQLEQQILKVAENEKRELAHDLHDTICQELGGLVYVTDTLADKLQEESHSQAGQTKRIAKQLFHLMESSRRLSHSLDPLLERPGDLQPALRLLTSATRETYGIDCRLTCADEVGPTDANTATNLYRIAQEAAHNAFRHGKASKITFTLRKKQRREIILTISDNGCGMVEGESPPAGMGIRLMKYRIATLGGSIKIETRRNKGFKIICSVPLSIANEKTSSRSIGENQRWHKNIASR